MYFGKTPSNMLTYAAYLLILLSEISKDLVLIVLEPSDSSTSWVRWFWLTCIPSTSPLSPLFTALCINGDRYSDLSKSKNRISFSRCSFTVLFHKHTLSNSPLLRCRVCMCVAERVFWHRVPVSRNTIGPPEKPKSYVYIYFSDYKIVYYCDRAF